MEEITETLKQADNEATAAPYWLIVDPRQMMKPDCHHVASMITGPFFSRSDAEEHLEARRHAFSKRAVVYCASGCWSRKYKDFCAGIGKV